MPTQDTISEEVSQEQGIVVPLELAELRILKQEVQADGRLRVEVIGTNEQSVGYRYAWGLDCIVFQPEPEDSGR